MCLTCAENKRCHRQARQPRAAAGLQPTTSIHNLPIVYIVDGLSGPATASQIFEGAPGATGPLYMPLFLPSPVSSGQFPIDGSMTSKLESGNTYLNIITDAFPNGEIRGQVLREFSCAANIVGVAELPVSSFSVMPNPTNGRTIVQFYAENAFDGQLALLDLTGRVVRVENHHFSPGEQSIQMDLTTLPAGLYLARLSNDQGAQRTFKLVRE